MVPPPLPEKVPLSAAVRHQKKRSHHLDNTLLPIVALPKKYFFIVDISSRLHQTATAVKKEKKVAADAMVTPLIKAVVKQPVEGSVQHILSITTNSKNQDIVLAPLSVPLSEVFLQTDDSYKRDIQGYIFQNQAFESEDNKEVEKLLKAGAAFMEFSLPASKDWHHLFIHVCGEGADINDTGVECPTSVSISRQGILWNFLPLKRWTLRAIFFINTLLLLGSAPLFVWARSISSLTPNYRTTV